ncbi:hypothetical protein L9F63_007645 [Diploptera punctata]|uniref:ER membrane protein complex subunit 1 n=1 Tax=Diploptera punctata TaxID=6984 RepID=A0AAD8E3Q9_DIPPU|nr:hypothetical protein L9F63_007645 [Diploptera punctata]
MDKIKYSVITVIFFSFLTQSLCLYEDQIGKFDWRQTYVGKLKFASFDTTSTVKKVFVATEENVVAALNLKSGQIIWRHVLEKAEQGQIQFMNTDEEDIITVSGKNTVVARLWDPQSGYLNSEFTLTQTPHNRLINIKWFLFQKQLFQVSSVALSHISVTVYNITTESKASTYNIPAPWITEESRCVLAAPYLACLATIGQDIVLQSVTLTGNAVPVQTKVLTSLIGEGKSLQQVKLDLINGEQPAVSVSTDDINKHVLYLQTNGFTLYPKLVPASSKLFLVHYEKNNILLQSVLTDGWLEMSGSELSTGMELSELEGKIKYPTNLGEAYIAAAACSSRKEKGLGCRILLATDDHAIALIFHPGKFVWIREEALASIAAVEILDLPVSDTDAAIEKEFDHKETGFLGMFVHRLTSQLLQLRSLILTILGLGEPPSADQRAGLVRDEFGLHKMIVAASSAGKVFGIDNLSGEIIWQHRLESVKPYVDQASGKNHMPFFVQRTTRHFPNPAQCALLLRHKMTNEGMLFVFNPITGHPLAENNGLIRLGYKVKQTFLLHEANRQFLRGILLLDSEDNLHVYPEDTKSVAASVASTTFIFTADPNTGLLVGYSLALSTQQKLIASRVWEIKLTQGSQRITAVVSKSSIEKVHSQGRVLGDRSVLYKYINPNLVAVLTQGFDPVHKRKYSLIICNVICCSVVFSITQKRARDPVHIVHSENWLLYSYVSDITSRRTESVTLELYEGKVQTFSSVAAPLQPIVDRQAYILAGMIESMKETITEKGITSKHILVSLANGGILELPWIFVDPRRPITVTPEMREEGVIPYIPELPLPHDAIINYNQTVQRVKGIHTAPSGLESTCLVFVYGLDLFYTRVSPSKTFDLLKEDFDHFLITAVLLGLTVTSYITKKLSSRKALKQAWK